MQNNSECTEIDINEKLEGKWNANTLDNTPNNAFRKKAKGAYTRNKMYISSPFR